MVPLFLQQNLLTSCRTVNQSSTNICLSSFPRSLFLSVLHLHSHPLTHTYISSPPLLTFLCYSCFGPQKPAWLIDFISQSHVSFSSFLLFLSPFFFPGLKEQHSLLSLQILESQGKEGKKGNDVLSILTISFPPTAKR